jgi:kynurenine formamidase
MCTEKCLELARGSKVSRRTAMAGAAAVAASAALGGTAQAGEREREHGPAFGGGRHLRDLTHVLTTSIPPFAPGEQPERETVATIEDDGYYMQKWHIIEHIGTHVDAPGHFIEGGRLGPELKPSELIVPAVVVNIADRAARDPDTVVTVDDLRAFERRHGRIPRDSAVLMDSGWAAKIGDVTAYRGAPIEVEAPLHFPGFGAEATEWLLRHRRIRALGVDTLSIDPGISETFDTHLILLGADRYGIENLNNLDRIPRRGATIMVGLIPYEDGSGGQARVLASW